MNATIAEALRGFRSLRSVDAGRLRGLSLTYDHHRLAGELPASWPEQLRDAVRARSNGIITATTPEYVVFSGPTPVVWLTVHGHVHTTPVPMAGTHARHLQLAAEALRDVHRWVLIRLADARDQREGRPNTHPTGQPETPAIRVGPDHDPTLTTWTTISGDYHTTVNHLHQLAETLGGRTPRILEVRGYGLYGQHEHRLDPQLLCAMHTIVETDPDVSLALVGNWLAVESGTSGLSADLLARTFTHAYQGRYQTRREYAVRYADQWGWTTALDNAGISRRYLDWSSLESDLFATEVFDISCDATDGRRTAVFARRDHNHGAATA